MVRDEDPRDRLIDVQARAAFVKGHAAALLGYTLHFSLGNVFKAGLLCGAFFGVVTLAAAGGLAGGLFENTEESEEAAGDR